MAGQNVNCPGCGERISVPKEQAAPAGFELPKGERKRGGWPETDPSNVSAWRSLALGLVGMGVSVGALYLVRDSFAGRIFFSGGWVNYVELLLFFWGLGMLVLKNRKNKRQRAALLLDVLPKDIAKQIKEENVGLFIAHLYRLPEHLRDSMMVNRIRKALELFEARTNNSEAAALMNAQSNVDANRIAGSYALLKVFLWALPILGFVGTVLGLSFAMAGFGSADLTDINALKIAVGAITTGLASAFNTTLLGLLLSMLLIFPMSAMQKREEDCLNDIDAFCNENVLPRLNDESAAASSTAGAPADLGRLGEMLREFAGGQKQFVTDLHKVSESVQDLATVVQYAAQQIDERSKQHQQRVEEKLGQSLDELMTKASESVAASGRGVEKYVSRLAVGIDSLNNALATLGEKKIVLHRPPRRGWFFHRKS
jgi:biopolymer transport protein ExbB/TolQ